MLTFPSLFQFLILEKSENTSKCHDFFQTLCFQTLKCMNITSPLSLANNFIRVLLALNESIQFIYWRMIHMRDGWGKPELFLSISVPLVYLDAIKFLLFPL